VGGADDGTLIEKLQGCVARGVKAQDRGEEAEREARELGHAQFAGPPVEFEQQLATREFQRLDHVDEPPHRSRKRTEDMSCLPRRLHCGCAARRSPAILGGGRRGAQPRSTGFAGIRLDSPSPPSHTGYLRRYGYGPGPSET
jgi:hypothetical protein